MTIKQLLDVFNVNENSKSGDYKPINSTSLYIPFQRTYGYSVSQITSIIRNMPANLIRIPYPKYNNPLLSVYIADRLYIDHYGVGFLHHHSNEEAYAFHKVYYQKRDYLDDELNIYLTYDECFNYCKNRNTELNHIRIIDEPVIFWLRQIKENVCTNIKICKQLEIYTRKYVNC